MKTLNRTMKFPDLEEVAISNTCKFPKTRAKRSFFLMGCRLTMHI